MQTDKQTDRQTDTQSTFKRNFQFFMSNQLDIYYIENIFQLKVLDRLYAGNDGICMIKVQLSLTRLCIKTPVVIELAMIIPSKTLKKTISLTGKSMLARNCTKTKKQSSNI